MDATIRSGNFSVTVDAPNAIKYYRNGHTYVSLHNQTPYILVLHNYTAMSCDVTVSINERTLGRFHIQPFNYISVDPSDHKWMILLSGGNHPILFPHYEENRLIKVKFVPKIGHEKIITVQLTGESGSLEVAECCCYHCYYDPCYHLPTKIGRSFEL